MNYRSIILTAENQTVLEAALTYADLGMSVVPLVGKRVTVSWTERQTSRAKPSLIHVWDRNGQLKNVGIVTGRVSGNLVVIDLDGLDAISAFEHKFPELLDTYIVASGSGRGAHLYYYTTFLPNTTRATSTKIGNVELRADGCYVAAPPSIHPETGAKYVVSMKAPIMRVNNLDPVVSWIKDLIKEKHGGQLPPPNERQQPTKSVRAWAAAAMRAECDAVRLAPVGSRQITLNRAAFKLGQIIANGDLNYDDVYNRLYESANDLREEDGDQSVIHTIIGGLTAGQSNPRQVKRA